MSLKEYEKKRRLDKSGEPRGDERKTPGKALSFVVQKHDATRLHYDFRLEAGGTLKSWAVPKGPSMDPDQKHLAVMVEDHPIDYGGFEGTIPIGNYGAGTVMVWDSGAYLPAEGADDPEAAMRYGLNKGHVAVVLLGEKLKGRFDLVKTNQEENSWLLMKYKDEFATKTDILKQENSALTGRDLEAITKDAATWKSDRNLPDLSMAPTGKLPTRIKPMLAEQVDEPFDGKGWIYEVKWDGYRAIAEVRKTSDPKLYSRNDLSFNEAFPPVVEALKGLGYDAVLDGEVVALDKSGRSSFQQLQNARKGVNPEALVYVVFDILYLEGRDLTNLPLRERKEILKAVLPKSPHLKYSDHIDSTGVAFFKAAEKQKLEGIMAKKAESKYGQGLRSRSWLKIKTVMRQEAVICGYTSPRASRKHFGALILGAYDKQTKKLHYIGHSGGGFTDKELRELKARMKELETKQSPIDPAPKTNEKPHWIKPKLVCEIKFQEWTEAGTMRKPIFIGMREDKPAKQVYKEAILPVEETVPENDHGKPNTDVEITHPDKVFWPKEGYTKADLVDYYRDVSEFVLPYLKDRPESMNRHPDGIDGENFFQKNFEYDPPDFVRTHKLHSDSGDKDIRYLVCDNPETLLYMANLGCIEINPWNSRIGSIDKPDWIVIDLDPEDISFKEVVKVAQQVHKTLETLDIPSYPKTSGATGIHIYIPLGAQYSYEAAKNFAHLLVTLVNKELPQITSLERSPAKRQKRVYLDYLQNRRGQTLATAYSARPKPGATVSTPLEWSEVTSKLDPGKFTIKNVRKRLDKKGDLFKPVLGKGVDIKKKLEQLSSND